jgi:serine/threonine protein kinase
MSESHEPTSFESDSVLAAHSRDDRAAEISDSTSDSRNDKRLLEVISDVISRRSQGDFVSIEEVIAAHPELMPKLREELLALNSIHQAILVSRTQCVASDSQKTLSVTSTHISVSTTESLKKTDAVERLRIHGFLIEGEISSGGQATVFRATQENTGRKVAIKVIHGGPYAGSRNRKRFDRESNILARLSHPNVVGILDQGRTSDGSFFLAMDFIDGQNLDRALEDLGKDSAAIVRLFIKIANALDDAHQQQIVHRDLKPMNILVDIRGEPHILDFGMARILRDDTEGLADCDESTVLTRTGQVLGSLPWASPEQVSASPESIDSRSDVYALGVMLYNAFADGFPYPVRGTPQEITNHIAGTSPESLRRRARLNGIYVAPYLEEIILKSLAKSPSMRYPSAGALAKDLESYLSGKTGSLKRRFSRIGQLTIVFALVTFWSLLSFDSPAVVIRATSFVNPVGMRFVMIPPGAVPLDVLRKNQIRINWHNDPYVHVSNTFYMSDTPVTQEQFRRVMGRNPSDPNCINLDAPVQCVTFEEAKEFCDALTARCQAKYRLPTTAEWKYAFYSSALRPLQPNELDRMTWFGGNSGLRLQPVAQKHPNRWGLYDMVGDVRQWCSRPSGVSPPSQVRGRVIEQFAEGADFRSPASDCLPPSDLEITCAPGTMLPTIGFRVVCESPNKN